MYHYVIYVCVKLLTVENLIFRHLGLEIDISQIIAQVFFVFGKHTVNTRGQVILLEKIDDCYDEE